MSVSHEQIMEQMMALTTKVDAMGGEIAALKASQEKTAELLEAFAAFKTGGRFVAWMSKFTAGAIAIWVLIKGGTEFVVQLGNWILVKGGAEFLVELGKQ